MEYYLISAIMKLLNMKVSIIIILILSIFFGILSGYLSQGIIEREASTAFQRDINLYKKGLNARLNTYESLLISLQAFIDHSEIVTQEEWDGYIEFINLEENYPGAVSVAYVDPVAVEDFEEYEKTQLPFATIRPYADGEEHEDVGFIVKYISPLTKERREIVGLDIFTNPPRKAAIIESLKSRSIGSTNTILHIDGTTKAFDLVTPIFSENGNEIKALSLIAFERDIFFKELILDEIGFIQNYSIEIYDGDNLEFSEISGVYDDSHVLQTEVDLRIPQDDWSILIKARTSDYIIGFNKVRPYVAGIAVFGLFFGINLALIVLYKTSRSALTKAEKTSNELIKNRSLLKTLIDNYSAVIYIKDLNNKLILVNKKYESLVGVERHDLIGKSEKDHYPFEDYQKSLSKDRAVKDGEIVKYEENIGEYVYDTIKFGLDDNQGDTYAIAAISIDVTLSRNTQNKLEERNEQLEKLTRLMVGRELKMAELKDMVKTKEKENSNG